MEWIYKLDQLAQTASQLWQIAGKTTIFAFHGAIGSGKTTFIHALCDIKKVKDVVGSPTFSIINEYVYFEGRIPKKVFHIDLYRLKDEEEVLQAGVDDCIYSGNICMIEWPEKILSRLPDGTAHLYIEALGEQTRKLRIGDN